MRQSLIALIRFLFAFLVVFFDGYLFEFQPRIVFIDVGQGDSTLILPEEGVQILVDGGSGSYLLEALGRHIPPWDRVIEYVVLTHPHADHVNGLFEVLDDYQIKNVIYNPICEPNMLQEIFRSYFEGGQSPVGTEELVDVGRTPIWSLNSLYPPIGSDRIDYCDESSNVNDSSVVLLLQYAERRVLLMGDAEAELEEVLLEEGNLIDVDILKAGHHCSKTSTTEAFLDQVTPEIAICSVGEDNRHGHPSPETLEKFRNRGINYLLTSKEGDIIINL